jgi:diguanylate cyclase (GGDEF)-like protein
VIPGPSPGRSRRRSGDRSLLPEPIGEFGPFNHLSEWAHALYVDDRAEQTLTACAEALTIVEAAGDRHTASYLHYIACLVHEMEGHWARLRLSSQALLDRLDPEAGPYWRAKALGMQALALIKQGRQATALDTLAEAYGLIIDHPGTSYNRGSACQAVSTPLHAALLFEPATRLLRTAQRILDRDGPAGALAAVEEAEVLGTWGLFLELLGAQREADARYGACASAALRADRMAARHGGGSAQGPAYALLQFAAQRLRCGQVDQRVLASAARPATRESLLPRLALASLRAREGDLETARTATLQVRLVAGRLGEPVPLWVATAWLAELEVAARAETDATRRWRESAVGTLERLWRDQGGRFEYLLARHGVAKLSTRMIDDHTRLWEDPLTGAGNRRRLDELLAVPGIDQRPMAFIDVNRFKAINDTYGHDAGDEVLRRLASELRSLCRAGDAVIRYGGDEFVIILGEHGDVVHLAERIQAEVAAMDWAAVAPGLRVGVTVGTAAAGPGALHRADAALLASRRDARSVRRPPTDAARRTLT